MSEGLSLESFSGDALSRLFAAPSAEDRAALLALGRPEAERALAAGRLSYDGLAPRERVAVDRFVTALFGDARLAATLEVETAALQDPLDLEALNDLLVAADLDRGGRLLMLLAGGRRLGGWDQPLGGEYVVYGVEEVQALRAALEATLASGRLHGATADVVRAALLPAVEAALARGRWLHASTGFEHADAFARLCDLGPHAEPGSGRRARYELSVLGDAEAALLTYAAMTERGARHERAEAMQELVVLCARLDREADARRWRARLEAHEAAQAEAAETATAQAHRDVEAAMAKLAAPPPPPRPVHPDEERARRDVAAAMARLERAAEAPPPAPPDRTLAIALGVAAVVFVIAVVLARALF